MYLGYGIIQVAQKKGVDLIKISFPYLGTSNSEFKLNLTQRVTGSLVYLLIDCVFEAVRTNPGYVMATPIHNFWDLWELFFVFARKLGWIFIHPKPYLRFWIFEIKYYNKIRANFLSFLICLFYYYNPLFK